MIDAEAVVAALQHGKERIARGWCKGTIMNERGEVCASGALGAPAAADQELYGRATDMLLLVTGCERPHASVTSHNDYCLAGQADALDWFDRAIRMAKDQRSE